MIVHRAKKSEALSNHRQVTYFAETARELESEFQYFSVHLNHPCAIMKVDFIKEGDVVEDNTATPYALFSLDQVLYVSKKSGKSSFHYPPIQEQLDSNDFVASIGGYVKQHKDFMMKVIRG